MNDENNEVLILKKERSSNFEILRIIAMVMIIFHHFAVHGDFSFGHAELSINHFWYFLMEMGGKIGVDIFVLISGYFLINNQSKMFDISKILKLWGQIVFYSVLIYGIFVLTGLEEFSVMGLISSFFPLINEKWWFATTYVVLYILHPFINILLNKISKKDYQLLLILLLTCWCIIPTFTGCEFAGSNVLWFITLYSIAGYFKLYGFNPKFKINHYLLMLLISFVIICACPIVCTLIAIKIEIVGEASSFFFGQNKIPVLLVSVSLFMLFANLQIKNSKSINIISSCTFGVYLIHDSGLVRPYLWRTLFVNASFQNSNWLIPYSIGVCLLVFVVCVLIDLIRKYSIDLLYCKVVDKQAIVLKNRLGHLMTD